MSCKSCTQSCANKDNSTSHDPHANMRIALVGSPNCGKSTLFNRLTGLHQHTGNWPGKTVGVTHGRLHKSKSNNTNKSINIIDLPGTYGLGNSSPDEEVTREALEGDHCDAIIIVLDATALERQLPLVYLAQKYEKPSIVVLNLIDEAKRRGISIDLTILSEELSIPVIATAARRGDGIDRLTAAIEQLQTTPPSDPQTLDTISDQPHSADAFALGSQLAQRAVQDTQPRKTSFNWDRLLLHPLIGLVIMFFLLALVFYLTIAGANIPSSFLASALHAEGGLQAWFQDWMGLTTPDWLAYTGEDIMHWLCSWMPSSLHDFSVNGVYRACAWVIAVMLPPMAIFFPMFTWLEDAGYLPRAVYILDPIMKPWGGHGKQALTMAMGFGCNAAGVVSCRIIESPRERIIAMVTNSFVPCNGRFPTLVVIAALFLAPLVTDSAISASLVATTTVIGAVLLGAFATVFWGFILSRQAKQHEGDAFLLELPPFRRPDTWYVLYRSLHERTIFVLWRAVVFAIPAGAVLWLFSNWHPADVNLIAWATNLLDPVAAIMGLSGAILLAFILAAPANEIVVPSLLVVLGVTQEGLIERGDGELYTILNQAGWTLGTAVCFLLFVVFHQPCTTTIYSVWAETKSIKWTAVATGIPLITGCVTCALVALLF